MITKSFNKKIEMVKKSIKEIENVKVKMDINAKKINANSVIDKTKKEVKGIQDISNQFNPNDINGMKINGKPYEDYILKIKGARTELGKFSKIKTIETPKIDTGNVENATRIVKESTDKIKENIDKVEPSTNRFNKVIDRIKNGFNSINSKPIEIDVEDAELDLLEYKISELEEKLQNAGKLHLSTEEIVETRAKLSKLNNEYDKLINKEDESSSKGNVAFNSLNNGIGKAISKIKMFALSLFSISTVYSVLSRASSAYLSADTSLANKLQAVWVGLGAILEPVISRIVNVMLKAVKYINVFIKALTGVDLLAKATNKSLNGTTKSAKALSKTLAGFDELTNLDTTSNTSGAGIDTSLGDVFKDVEINTDWADKIREFGEWLKKNWKPIVIGIGLIVGAIVGFKVISSIIKLLSSFKKSSTILKGISADFTGLLNGIGKAAEAIAILGGIALVIKEVTGLITAFSESGLSLSDVAILLGSVLGELALAFTAVVGATKLMDWQGIAGAAVILGGFALIINQVTGLIDAFSKSGMKVSDVAKLMASIFGSVVIAMTAMALIAKILCSDPLTLIGLVALVASISTILIVVEKTLPTILDSCSKFIREIAPVVITLIKTINECINNTIRALGEVLPPIIRSIGSLFDSIFNGISKVVTSVGNSVSKIIDSIRRAIQQIGNTIEQVANTIIGFIRNLGPAINNFVDNTIKAVTKLVNFVVSAIEYLVNRSVDGINGIASVINQLPGVNIAKKSYVYIPRFVPKLNVGTGYVPEDQMAYIHKGEAVIPKKFNSKEYFGGSNEETNSLLQTLIEKVENIEINPYTTIRDVGQASIDYVKLKERRTGKKVFA